MTGTDRAIAGWLAIVCFAVFAMIVVGGVTRLTESGLSIVEWQPIMGIVPPLNEEEWQSAFDAYKQFPQYREMNRDMDLAGFRQIFYWEYVHRALGRTIGVLFFVPFVFFWWRGQIERRLMPPLIGALVLGGLQGLLGWYMVMSGLIDIPRVSHYRLAAHLLLAMFILSYLFWLVLELIGTGRERVSLAFRRLGYALTALAVLQIFYGALTAGIRAGYGYNTYPKMHDQWIADAVFFMEPWWINLIESSATIQFMHRWIGAGVVLVALTVWILSRRYSSPVKWAAASVLGALLIQFALGVLTLVNVIPLGLASFHQAWACVVLLTIVYLVYLIFPAKES